jgi:hypothetical protein
MLVGRRCWLPIDEFERELRRARWGGAEACYRERHKVWPQQLPGIKLGTGSSPDGVDVRGLSGLNSARWRSLGGGAFWAADRGASSSMRPRRGTLRYLLGRLSGRRRCAAGWRCRSTRSGCWAASRTKCGRPYRGRSRAYRCRNRASDIPSPCRCRDRACR